VWLLHERESRRDVMLSSFLFLSSPFRLCWIDELKKLAKLQARQLID